MIRGAQELRADWKALLESIGGNLLKACHSEKDFEGEQDEYAAISG